MSGTVETNVFTLNKLYQLVVDGQVQYTTSGDPGQLWSWGQGLRGRLGTGDEISRSSPVQVAGTSWLDVSAGGDNTLARKTDNTLWAWGCNDSGQIGTNNIVSRSSPIQVPGTAWTQISSGYSFSFARKSDNTLWAWGSNARGVLGINNLINRSSPTQIPGTSWVDVVASDKSDFRGVAFARKSDGTLWGWGSNQYDGKIGDNTIINRSSPVQIPGTSWVEVAAARHVLARKTDGTLWAWGNGNDGGLGDNLSGFDNCRSSPVQVPGTSWSQIATGFGSSFARKSDGTLWAWGSNGVGQLGDGTTICRSSPIQIPGTSWSDVSATSINGLARKTDSTLWMWGSGNYMADNTQVSKSSPIQIPGTSWIQVEGGCMHAFARKSP